MQRRSSAPHTPTVTGIYASVCMYIYTHNRHIQYCIRVHTYQVTAQIPPCQLPAPKASMYLAKRGRRWNKKTILPKPAPRVGLETRLDIKYGQRRSPLGEAKQLAALAEDKNQSTPPTNQSVDRCKGVKKKKKRKEKKRKEKHSCPPFYFEVPLEAAAMSGRGRRAGWMCCCKHVYESTL